MLRILLVASAGALLGTLAEILHLWTGVWSLGNARSFPWWITAIYFGGFVGFGFLLERFERRPERRLAVTRRDVALEATAFLALLVLPSLLPRAEILLTALATAWVLVRLLGLRAPGDLDVCLAAAAANLAIELPLAWSGLYHYGAAQWLPVPVWLAPFWAGLALGLRRFFVFARG